VSEAEASAVVPRVATVIPGMEIGPQRFAAGREFTDFLATVQVYADFWRSVYAHARVSDVAVTRLAAVSGAWHLLVLTEDWCPDSLSTLPVVARLTEHVGHVDLRILGRDVNPDLMDAHLTNRTRSIPVIMVLDAQYREWAWWGPRPEPLQAWFLAEGRFLPKVDRYREMRRWYARDHGATAIDELVALVEASAKATSGT